jgi:hypothetical protein
MLSMTWPGKTRMRFMLNYWWLHRTLGPGESFETLLYLGPNDLRHNILLLGAVKAGYKVSTATRVMR